jgi:NAD(P)-dependent dehydrogenase (short-subunit alcohol dehydrogenase family)
VSASYGAVTRWRPGHSSTVITGAGAGVGPAVALKFVPEWARVRLVDEDAPTAVAPNLGDAAAVRVQADYAPGSG